LVPEIEEIPGAMPRRNRFWQQLKGRFRRDGKGDRNGDARGEAAEPTETSEGEGPPKRD